MTTATSDGVPGPRGATITVCFDSQPTRLTFRPPASVHMVIWLGRQGSKPVRITIQTR